MLSIICSVSLSLPPPPSFFFTFEMNLVKSNRFAMVNLSH